MEITNQEASFLLGSNKERSKLAGAIDEALQRAKYDKNKIEEAKMGRMKESLQEYEEKLSQLFGRGNEGIEVTRNRVESYLSQELANGEILKYEVTVDNVISDTCGQVIAAIYPWTEMETVEIILDMK